MHPHRKLRLALHDDSRLNTLWQLSGSPARLGVSAFLLLALLIALACVIVLVSPLRHLLPVNLEDEEREATEMKLLRVDSLMKSTELKNAYLANVMRVTDISRPAADSVVEPKPDEVYPEELLHSSPAEERFYSSMSEREKFNISIVAPMAGEAMTFYPPSERAVMSADSKGEKRAKLLIPGGEPTGAVADGMVVAVYYSPEGQGYSVMIQHARGFLSRLSRLGQPLVGVGDPVSGAQAVALPRNGAGRRSSVIWLELWHNGTSLPPSDYIIQKNH